MKTVIIGVLVLSVTLFASVDAVAKRKRGEKGERGERGQRKIASVPEQCKAIVGNSGDSKGLEKVFEVYFEGCLAASDSTAEMEFLSTTHDLLRGSPAPVTLKVKQNKVPFVYAMGGYEYHMYQGEIVGVTRGHVR